MTITTRIKSFLGLETRSELGLNGWPLMPGASTVTPSSAQSVAAVFGCVAAISETVASLPLILYRKTADGDRERARDHSLYRVLHDQFNPQMTSLEGREFMQACVLLNGNAYARIERNSSGQVVALWPMSPDSVQVRRQGDGLIYEHNENGVMTRYLDHEILHIRNRLGNDRIMGVSPIAVARGTIELAAAEQAHGVSTFNNGGKLLGVLKFPGVLKTEQRQAIASSWATQYSGSANAGKTAILESGVDFQPLSMTLEDSSWIEARKLSVIEICRLFRVPPLIVQSMESANYSNSTELFRQFIVMTLARHLTAWEQALNAKCLTEAGRRTYFVEHEVNGVLRGDTVTRASFYSSGIASGWLLKSEVRKLENLSSVPGIDDGHVTGDATPAAQPYPSKQV